MFLSVGWVSDQYPQRLYKALMHSSTVLTVWDGDRLIGLIRVLDDSEMLAQIHYVLVHPDYQGQGIAGELLERIKEKYKNYLYIEGIFHRAIFALQNAYLMQKRSSSLRKNRQQATSSARLSACPRATFGVMKLPRTASLPKSRTRARTRPTSTSTAQQSALPRAAM